MDIPKEGLFFLGSQAAALAFAGLYRCYLGPEKVSPSTRHSVSLVLGLCLGFFCFGTDFLHLLVQATLCYLCLKTLPLQYIHIIVFITAMGHLAIFHFYTTFLQQEQYYIDISGPLMLSTQKITSLAFSLHDGCYKDEAALNDDQKTQAIRKAPSTLEYYSFVFYFQGVLVGPPSFYNDYKAFVDGTDVSLNIKQNGKQNGVGVLVKNRHPPATAVVLQKVGMAVVWMLLFLNLSPLVQYESLVDEDFIKRNHLPYRLLYASASMFAQRAKYYFVWMLGDGICNLSGFGFNGYDSQGQPKWDLVTNIRVYHIEFSTSIKNFVDNWNIQSATWLRRVCYDRVPFQKTFLTFLLSGVWHGFYAGYYFTLVAGVLGLLAGRKIRRHIRPYFLSNKMKKRAYDLLTWFGMHILIAYVFPAFKLLTFQPCMEHFNNCYWFLHIVFVLLIILPWERVISFRVKDS